MELVKKVRGVLTVEFVIASLVVGTLGAVFVVPLAVRGINALRAKFGPASAE